MRIEYEASYSECKTPCPFIKKTAKHIIMVGSWLCKDCEYCISRDTNIKVVECSHFKECDLPEGLFEL